MSEYLLYSLLAGFIAFFLLPIRVALRIRRRDFGAPLEFGLRWAFFRGLAGIEIQRESPSWLVSPLLCGVSIAKPRLRLTAGPKKPVVEKPAERGKPKKNLREVVSHVRSLADLLAVPGFGLVRRLPRTISLHRLAVNGSFGFANPSSTGSLCGYIHAINTWDCDPITLSLRPEFTRSGLQGQVTLALHFHHGYALFSVMQFACNVAYRYLARCAGIKMRRIRRYTAPKRRNSNDGNP